MSDCLRGGRGGAYLKAKKIARQVEVGDLAPSVLQNLVAAHRAIQHPVEVLGRLALAENLDTRVK